MLPEGTELMLRTRMFDAQNAIATPRHAQVYGRYEKAYTLIDFMAAVTFVAGSVLFFFESQQIPATSAFLVGSVFFAARPTVTVLREFHLARIPLPGDATAGDGRQGSETNGR